ncbi:MAG: hypothetical protein JWQ90_1229 [Hydrocarboniphaga sp.]|uniref:hypothetical protein n=1 Tax=Hydrocarboniphaga sp. TaxID=2033016 RepID=UPI00262B41DA|nr:hypothetical protein [Hydrocarboniphaga sp.]MDB5968779.1 hypothetical protein [Hydrocarboniphaga sp.]
MPSSASKPPRRLDFIRLLGLAYSATYKEWHARFEVKDSATAIRQTVTGKVGRKLHFLDPKSRSFTFKVLKISHATGPAVPRACAMLEISDGTASRIEVGQIMLRDAANPEWRFYEAPESEDRFDHSQFA